MTVETTRQPLIDTETLPGQHWLRAGCFYTGAVPAAAAAAHGIPLGIVTRREAQHRLAWLSRRRVAERSFAWKTRLRRH